MYQYEVFLSMVLTKLQNVMLWGVMW